MKFFFSQQNKPSLTDKCCNTISWVPWKTSKLVDKLTNLLNALHYIGMHYVALHYIGMHYVALHYIGITPITMHSFNISCRALKRGSYYKIHMQKHKQQKNKHTCSVGGRDITSASSSCTSRKQSTCHHACHRWCNRCPQKPGKWMRMSLHFYFWIRTLSSQILFAV